METLKIKKATAIKIFNKASAEIKEILNETFGPECFSGKIIDRVKTFEDACEIASVTAERIYNESDTQDEIAYKKLKFIIRVINEGWKPDWNNTSQRKWYPWFRLSSGFGFGGSDFIYDGADTSVGSRLCFETEEKSEYVAKQFIDLYETFLTIK